MTQPGRTNSYGPAEKKGADMPKESVFDDSSTRSMWKYLTSKDYRTAWTQHVIRLEEKRKELQAFQKQAEIDEEEDIRLYFDRLRGAIRGFSNTRTSFTVLHPKGGIGKTPTICYVASVLGEISRRPIVLFEHHQMQGTAGDQLGLTGTVSLHSRKAAELFAAGMLNDSGSFTGDLPITKHGVMVVTSEEVVEEGELYGEEVSATNIQFARKHAQFIANDTDNAIQIPATKGVLLNTDVIIFPTSTDEVTLRMTRKLRENLTHWGYGDLVARSITVLSGIEPGDQLEDYREKLGLSETDVLLTVPFDTRIFKRMPIDLDETDFYVQIAYREIALAMLYASHAKSNPGFAEKLRMIRTGHLVDLPSGRTPVLPWIDGSNRRIA